MSDARPPRRANSFDVAERAGVSQSTVSRALAGSPAITEVTRNRVLEAARALDYHVDERAARLRRGTSGVVALVVIRRPGDDPIEGVNSFSYRLIAAVCAAAAARGYETLVSLQDEAERFDASYVATGQADAMVVIGTTSNREAWAFFERSAPDRVAFWGAPFAHEGRIVSDNFEGGRLAGAHLVACGCSRVALIGDADDAQRQFAARIAGCEAVLQREGLAAVAHVTGEGANREAQGRAAIAELLELGSSFDGIFAACDELALGALQECTARDLSVPGDVQVVGFDGSVMGAYSQPSLTTIKPDLMQAGQRLVDTALSSNKNGAHPVPVTLIKRASTI